MSGTHWTVPPDVIRKGDPLHASCVAVGGRAVILHGPSGSGKSSIAIQMMALGADLVADDRTIVEARKGSLFARCPNEIKGMIEARNVGLMKVPFAREVQIALLVDLGQEEQLRLPNVRTTSILGVEIPVIRKVSADHFPASLLIYLKHGRFE
ncbi:MAG: HPr kinase/phosphatase C-terminal domain-containing protein [Pseudomonadota bacterium]